MTQEDHDRLSILLDDAHKALEEAWRITLEAGERNATTALVLADMKVLDATERLGVVTDSVLDRIALYSVKAS